MLKRRLNSHGTFMKQRCLLFLNKRNVLSVISRVAQRFFNTNAGRFFNQLTLRVKISSLWTSLIIYLIISDLYDFET